MAKKNIEKMNVEEIKEYYERRALLYGTLFALFLLAIAFLGFFIGFQGVA